MRLRVFQANDGDCLLLSSCDGKHMLIDGGRSGSFTKHAAKSLSKCKKLDVVCVSHIDADHITGVLKLLETMVDWRIHLHEKENPPEGRKAKCEPSLPEPPKIGQIWHNGFDDQLEDSMGDIRTMLSLAATAQLKLADADQMPREDYLVDLATGEKQAIELSCRIGADQLNIDLNKHFGGKLVRADAGSPPYALGDASITILGPFDEDLKALRKQWQDWVEDNQSTIRDRRRVIDQDAERLGILEADKFLLTMQSIATVSQSFGDRDDITTPNLASIMVLVEEDGHTALLTGDGAGQDIVKGLKKAGKLDAEGRIHVDILKIQHHGAAANINLDFLKRVIADHYVFCGNGNHHNPELSVIKLVAESRMDAAGKRSTHPNVGDRFMLHFNSSKAVAGTKAQENYMREVEKLTVKLAENSSGQMCVRFLTVDFLDVEPDCCRTVPLCNPSPEGK